METRVAALLRAECVAPERSGTLQGWKVAVNVADAQRKLGIERPLAAAMRGSPIHPSGSVLHVRDGAQLHVEGEIAMVVAEDVHELVPLERLRSAIASYTPCFEIVDYALPRGDLRALFGHGFFHAGVVLGRETAAHDYVPLAPTSPTVTVGPKRVQRQPGTVPDDVVEAAHGLLARLIEAGQSLQRGQRILSGSYVEPIALAPDMTVRADFGEVLGTVELRTAR